jgi:hypothetical protein
MIADYKLTYPSGTATAYLINGFHTPEGAKLAKYICFLANFICKNVSIVFDTPVRGKASLLIVVILYFRKQVKTLGKYFVFSFFWGFFQWFYTAGDNCGFKNFPTLGLEAYNNI